MKAKFLFVIVMFSSFVFAQKAEMLQKAKIDSIIQHLNEWDNEELNLYERPDAYSPKLETSGETNGWIMDPQRQTKRIGC